MCNVQFDSGQYRYIYIGICNKMLFSIQHVVYIVFQIGKKQSSVDYGWKN